MAPRASSIVGLFVLALFGASCARRAAPAPATPAESPGYGTPSQQPGYPEPAQPSAPPMPTTESQPKSSSLPKDEDAAFSSVEEAQAALDRAREELDGMSAVAKKPQASGPGATTPPAKASEAPLAGADSRCANACRAFASLKRAADGVCRLTDETDARCTKARAIVKQNEPRVAACSCQEPS
jgi:hypothetical protein